MENAIEIKGVGKKYKEFCIENLNLNVPRGSIMGLLGENGAGKSTTIKMIIGVAKIEEGTINVLGQDNTKNPIEWKNKIGVVFDDFAMPENMNLHNINSIMKRTYLNWDEKVFENYAKRFNLSYKKAFKEFSKGMKAKLALTIALSHNAELLVLDEATSGLDPVVRQEILDVFLEFIENEKNSILISSHITSDLEKVCDYITFIKDGKIVICDSKDEILENYGVLKCSVEELNSIDPSIIKGSRIHKFGVEALVLKKMLKGNFVVDKANLDDIMLFFEEASHVEFDN